MLLISKSGELAYSFETYKVTEVFNQQKTGGI